MPTSLWGQDTQDAIDRARRGSTSTVQVDNRQVAVTTPFASPEDWRDLVIYFILVDRFNNPAAPPRHSPWDDPAYDEFQGGTLVGIRRCLPYLQDLGVGALWLSPIFKNCQYSKATYHGYGIQDFLHVEPRFASTPGLADRELRGLVDEAHARGIYVILDIVLNHAGDVFAYRDGGDTAPFNSAPLSVEWRDATGVARADWPSADTIPEPPPDALVWPVEWHHDAFFRRQGALPSFDQRIGDFTSLKQLCTEQPQVLDSLIRAYQYAIAAYDIDGFRLDTEKYLLPEVARVFGNAMREFALGIGKRNFFTFGEVYSGDEALLASFIGRAATDPGGMIGVDAALDYPLFFTLPGVAKGTAAPRAVADVFERRKQAERGYLSSHGEESSYFVTFLDNHDQHNRFYYVPDAGDLGRYDDQLTLGVGCLFALQGIPCLYYGTEQGLHGAGGTNEAVREALWGKPDAFDPAHPFYRAIRALLAVRRRAPALRYGRQYFRQVSGDAVHFAISTTPSGVLAVSRILSDQEVLVVANTNTQQAWSGEVIVDSALTPTGAAFSVLWGNRTAAGARRPTRDMPAGSVAITEMDGSVRPGPARSVSIELRPMEIQVLSTSG